MPVMMTLGLVTLLSSFLLFQVQPLVARAILPSFGGTPSVWTTCMLFFQCLLVAGYGYGHLLASRFEGRGQARTHAVLMGLSLLVLGLPLAWGGLPLLPGGAGLSADAAPQTQILRALGLFVGLPYLVLSTTAPLIQVWLRRLIPDASPYRLYALSNAGSLIGLLGYPLLVEPTLGLSSQAWGWTGLYLAFVGLTSMVALRVSRAPAPTARVELAEAERGAPAGAEVRPPRPVHYLAWIGLAWGASTLLLAVTNQLCQDVASFPLLWVLPLSLYLVTFILAFERPRWYPRGLWMPLYGFGAAVGTFLLPRQGVPLLYQVLGWSILLFSGCMVCHGELARSRPHPRYLTGFYLAVSVGGALGGLFVGLVAPKIFSGGYFEVHLAMAACALAAIGALWFDKKSVIHFGTRAAGVVSLFVLVLDATWLLERRGLVPPFLITYAIAIGVAAVVSVGLVLLKRGTSMGADDRSWVRMAVYVAIVALGVELVRLRSESMQGLVFVSRNFFGVKRITDEISPNPEEAKHNRRTLTHGRIVHGIQLIQPDRRRVPTSYYEPNSGLGVVLRNHPNKAGGLRIAMCGLGTGTVAAYVNKGDVLRFYEIDPDVPKLSTGKDPYFRYISDAREAGGKVEILIGDARVTMANELRDGGSQRYDVLAVDAFSGDAIPVHLITKEAVELYVRHIQEESGVIALHISNRYIDLRPVVRAAADATGLAYVVVNTDRPDPKNPPDPSAFTSSWILLARDPSVLAAYGKPEAPGEPRTRLWTDQYSNILRVMNL